MYESNCLLHMSRNGIPFQGPLICDGKIHRFSRDAKKSQPDEWYVAHSGLLSSGQYYLCCSYGSWSEGGKFEYKSWEDSLQKISYSAIERKELQAKIEENRHLVLIEQKKRHEEAAEKAKAIWNKALKQPSSEDYRAYLRLKGIDPHTARFGSNPSGYEALILPLWNIEGQIRSLQFISVGRDGVIYKTFLAGGEKRGCFCVIGDLKNVQTFFVSEGFATAASIHQATGKPVVIAFDAGNLEPVIAGLRTKYSSQMIIITGDDDVETEGNPGRTKAEEAAKAHGCRTAFPKFDMGTRLLNGKRPTDFNDLASLKGIEEVNRQIQEQEKVTDKTDTTCSEEWQQPIEFEETLPSVPPYDRSLLPEPLQRYVEDGAERMQCPPDFIAVGLLVAFSSLIGAGCGIRPKQRDNWTVVPNLWGADIGPPSVLKTPALNEGMFPLAHLEKIADEKHEKVCLLKEANEAEKRLRKKKLEEDLKIAIDNEAEGQIKAIKEAFVALERENRDKPWKRYKTNDATIEKLAELLKDNPRGMLVFRDELIGFLVTLDKDGREGDRSFYLEGWNGFSPSPVKSDRISRGTISSNPCISILGGIQPSKLRNYFMGTFNDLANDGLLQRFQLMVCPEIPKKYVHIDREPDMQARKRVFDLAKVIAESDFLSMGAMQEGDLPFPIFRFDPEAQEFFNEWITRFNNYQRSSSEEEIFVQHLGKFPKLLTSLALINCIIRIADSGGSSSVTLEDVKCAWRQCVYFEGHARHIYSIAGRKSFYRGKALLQKLKNQKLKDRFTLRDLYKNEWSGLSTKDDAKEACGELIERGWLQEEAALPSSQGGPSTTRYRLHPILLKMNVSLTDTTDITNEK